MKSIAEILKEQNREKGALAVLVNHRVAELDQPADENAEICPLTLHDEEGRRIYERTIRFAMLLALKKLYPGQRVRIEYSAGMGFCVSLPGIVFDQKKLRELREELNAVISADLPVTKESWTLERASAYFAADGQEDKVKLLKYRRLPSITMYGASWHGAELWDYFYGVMAPSTGFVRVFDLAPQNDGFILYLPAAADPSCPAPAADRPKLLEIFRQSADWCGILGVENAADLSEMIGEHQLRNFIRVNEALHSHALDDIAEAIVRKNTRVVLVAGPSSSGKTTFAGRLAVHLQVLGHRAYRLSMDDYYLNRDEIPREQDGTVDLEAITTLDLPLLREHIAQICEGREIDVPRFDFKTGKRSPEAVPLKVKPGEIVIIEGIHGMNPMLCEGIGQDSIFRVYISALTCLNLDDHNRIRTTDARLLRRIVRDYQFRGTLPEETLNMWDSVRRGEEKWIFPYQEQADKIFNSTLHYELPVLAHFARPLLKDISPETPCYTIACRLRKIMNYMPEIDEGILGEIPPLSLLREFIGGCTIEER